MSSEDELLEWLAQQSPLTRRIGNDGALLEAQRTGTVATVDTQIAGVHFPPDLDEALIARRLLAVNLSDLAAMGARPRQAFLSLTAPEGFDHRRFFESMLNSLDKHDTELAGGDLSRAVACHAVLFLLGSPHRQGHCVRRDTAMPGDGLWIGGSLGDSALGQRLVARGARIRGRRVALPEIFDAAGTAQRRTAAAAVRRHLLPRAQLELGAWLATRRRSAALDVSDGLALDARRLARASRVGLEIDLPALPRISGYRSLCERLGENPAELQLGGGEDYVLLFTLPRRSQPPAELGASKIGRVLEETELRLVEAGGLTRPMEALGWDHLRRASLSDRR
ncbi:MAG: thiamine-phosphate kinase [Acidobacteriota bacterium]